MLLTCKNLCVFYGKNQVLNNISFSVGVGEYIAVTGKNGSGKSTLIKAILGILPFSGDIILKDGFLKNDIGYLPQKTEPETGFPATVFEVVLSGFIKKNKIFCSAEEKHAAYKMLELFGISELKNKKFCELSGGQQQRTLICRAILATKKMLVLDESVAGLDSQTADLLKKTVDELIKTKKITVISVTHDINFALKRADKILWINNGSCFSGTPEQFLNVQKGNTIFGREGEV